MQGKGDIGRLMMSLSIVGGFYKEDCEYPHHGETLGSGGRAAYALSEACNEIVFYTFLGPGLKRSIQRFGFESNVSVRAVAHEVSVRFFYYHSLGAPSIIPDPLEIPFFEQAIRVEDSAILRFGMLEGSAEVHGDYVVYDPQNSIVPEHFSKNGSTANHLAIVCNLEEARKLTRKKNLIDCGNEFLRNNAEVVVIKNGVFGAYIFTSEGVETIPSYQTKVLKKIGTGDIFTAVFAYLWAYGGHTPRFSAKQASMAVANYCYSEILPLSEVGMVSEEKWEDKAVYPNDIDAKNQQIYLAAPLFGISQRWVIEEVRSILQSFGIRVFSPLHDVGHSEKTRYETSQSIAEKDLEGLKNSNVVLAIVEEYDPGTLVEIGYAMKAGKPVIVYSPKNLREEGMLMLNSKNITGVYDELDYAIYNAAWTAIKGDIAFKGGEA